MLILPDLQKKELKCQLLCSCYVLSTKDALLQVKIS